jgi:hypothetical protein
VQEQHSVDLPSKVKQSLYNPRHALSVLEGRDFQISRQLAHEACLSALRIGRFYPQEIFLVLISVRNSVDPRAIMEPEG